MIYKAGANIMRRQVVTILEDGTVMPFMGEELDGSIKDFVSKLFPPFPAMVGMNRDTEEYSAFWEKTSGDEYRAYRDGRYSIFWQMTQREQFFDIESCSLYESDRQMLEYLHSQL
jgi:hypothetical protein